MYPFKSLFVKCFDCFQKLEQVNIFIMYPGLFLSISLKKVVFRYIHHAPLQFPVQDELQIPTSLSNDIHSL